MPKINVLNVSGQNVGEIELNDSILSQLRLDQKSEVVVESHGDRKVLVELDRVL